MKKIAVSMIVIGVMALVGMTADASTATQEPSKVSGCDDCGKCRSDQYCCKTANGCVGCFSTACP